MAVCERCDARPSTEVVEGAVAGLIEGEMAEGGLMAEKVEMVAQRLCAPCAVEVRSNVQMYRSGSRQGTRFTLHKGVILS